MITPLETVCREITGYDRLTEYMIYEKPTFTEYMVAVDKVLERYEQLNGDLPMNGNEEELYDDSEEDAQVVNPVTNYRAIPYYHIKHNDGHHYVKLLIPEYNCRECDVTLTDDRILTVSYEYYNGDVKDCAVMSDTASGQYKVEIDLGERVQLVDTPETRNRLSHNVLQFKSITVTPNIKKLF